MDQPACSVGTLIVPVSLSCNGGVAGPMARQALPSRAAPLALFRRTAYRVPPLLRRSDRLLSDRPPRISPLQQAPLPALPVLGREPVQNGCRLRSPAPEGSRYTAVPRPE